jgi:hypothetical protein
MSEFKKKNKCDLESSDKIKRPDKKTIIKKVTNKCDLESSDKIKRPDKKTIIKKVTNKCDLESSDKIKRPDKKTIIKKVIIYPENSLIDYNKYANIIIRAFKKYKNMSIKEYACYNDCCGLGKWLIIIDDNKNPNPELFWLGNIIGVTAYKLWKDDRYNIKTNYSTTTCLCIYCGVDEKILTPEKQHNWILYIGKKLSKSPYLKQISMRSKIWFKENIKTSRGIYSFNSTNVCKLSMNIR